MAYDILGVDLEVRDLNATSKIKRFGTEIMNASRQVSAFIKDFNDMEKVMEKSASGGIFGGTKGASAVMNQKLKDASYATDQIGRAEQRMQQFYNNMEEASSRYHRSIMAGVALSMTGVGLLNSGRQMLTMWSKLITAAGQYNESLAKIQLTTGNFGGQTGAKLAASNATIRNTVTSAGIASPLSNLQMADMAQSLAAMGYHKTKDLNSLIAPSMMLQAVSANGSGGFELNQTQAAQAVSSLLRQSGQGIGNLINTRLGNQNFSGVSSNALKIIDEMTKAYHTAHLTYADQMSYINSSGQAISAGNMNIPDFLTLGGLMKMNGTNARKAGMDINGLMTSAQTLDAQNMMKPTARSKMASQLGFTVARISQGGTTVKNLTDIYNNALKMAGGNEQNALTLLHKVSNSTGAVVFAAIQKAIDNYKKKNGLSELTPVQMAQAVGNSNGYAENRFNVLYKQLPNLVQTMKGSFESLGIDLFSPTLNGLAKLVNGINNVVGALDQWVRKHPAIAKVLGYGLGLAGLLSTAAGLLFTFSGTMLSGIATLANFRLQMAMAAADTKHFNDAMVENGRIMSGNDLLGMSGVGKSIRTTITRMGLLGLAAGAAYLAWTHDFAGMKTEVTGLVNHVQTSFQNAQKAIDLYNNGTTQAFDSQMKNMQKTSDGWYRFSKFLVDVDLVFNAFIKSFNGNKLSTDQWTKLKDAGLLPILDTILNIKYEVSTFLTGFSAGFQGFGSKLKTVLSPLFDVLKMFGINVSGPGAGTGKDLTSTGKFFGNWTSNILVGIIAIKAYSRAMKGLFALIGGGIKFGKGVGGFFGGGWKGAAKKGGGWLTGLILGKDGKELTDAIASAVTRGIIEGFRQGASSSDIISQEMAGEEIFGSSIGVPGRRRGRRIGRGVRRGFSWMGNGVSRGYNWTRNKVGGAREWMFGGRNEYTPSGIGMPTHEGMTSQSAAEYENWWRTATNAPSLNEHDLQQLQYQQMFGSKAEGARARKILRSVHHGTTVGEGMTLEDITNGGFYSNSRHDMPLSVYGGMSREEVLASMEGGTLSRGSRFMNGIRASGRFAGKGLGFMKGFAGRGLGALGTVGMLAGMASGTDWSGAYKKGGVGGAIGAGLNTLGIGKKGGVGGALSGAASGAMIGMMFGPIGAGIGAAIGLGLGAIGTKRLQSWIKMAGGEMKKVGSALGHAGVVAWNGISKAGGVVLRTFSTSIKLWGTLFKAEWMVFSSIGKGVLKIIKDLFTGNFKDIGKQISGIWDGMKKAFMTAWNGITSFIRNNPITKAISRFFGGSQSSPSSSYVGGRAGINGAHAGGLSFVPYDGYIAELHRGERVLTAAEAGSLGSGSGSYVEGDTHLHIESGAIQVILTNASASETNRAAEEIYQKIMKKLQAENVKNHRPARMRGAISYS